MDLNGAGHPSWVSRAPFLTAAVNSRFYSSLSDKRPCSRIRIFAHAHVAGENDLLGVSRREFCEVF